MLLKRFGTLVAIALSLAGTPCVLFISTSNGLYLANQTEFLHDLLVLAPFVAAFLSLWLLGVVLYGLRTSGSIPLWTYYIAGPVYLLYSPVKDVVPEESGVVTTMIVLPVLVVLLAYALSQRASLLRARSVFAVLGVGLLCYEAILFGTRAEFPDLPITASALVTDDVTKTRSNAQKRDRLPNIYHVIFDGFQTDAFLFTVDERERGEVFSGFTIFPDNTASYQYTRLSMPSIFLGRELGEQETRRSYMHAQYSSDDSFLRLVVDAGYETYGFYGWETVPGLQSPLFDHNFEHKRFAGVEGNSQRMYFVKLWCFANLPLSIARWTMNSLELENFQGVQIMAPRYQLESSTAFRRYLELEPELADHGRYTFLHYIVPHPPCVLDRNCVEVDTATDTRSREAAITDQNLCAAKMLRQFVTTLKRLGRYEDSLVLVHADHGSGLVAVDNELHALPLPTSSILGETRVNPLHDAYHIERLRALLMIKPAGRGDADNSPFLEVDARTSLLDIAPTLAEFASGDAQRSYPGYSLLRPSEIPKDRVRHYFSLPNSRDLIVYPLSGPSRSLSAQTASILTGQGISRAVADRHRDNDPFTREEKE